MAKLHEILAIKDNYRSQAEVTRNDLKNTFEKKGHHFSERISTYKPIKEGEENTTDVQQTLQTTVMKELRWVSEMLAKAMDTSHQVNVTNNAAKADVKLESGHVILKDIPATSLLELEKRIDEIMDLVKAIPTLDPAKGFEVDTDRTVGDDGTIYKARDVKKPRTEKKLEYIVVAPATDKHPAQVKDWTHDEVVGHTTQQEWSSLLTVADKGDMLGRCEELMRAVKSARSRANDIEVTTKDNKIGQTLLDYVFKGRNGH